MMGGYGVPKCICEECENTVDLLNESVDAAEIREGCRKLGEALTRGDTGDESVIVTVNKIIAEAGEKAERIENGTYDPEEAKDEEEEFDITEDLEETEEDRKLDEEEARANKVYNTVSSWVAGIIIVIALGFFIYKLIA
jgi:hypothetical protein